MNDRRPKTPRYRCKLCGDIVPVSDLRDHLAGHSTAAESAIEDPTEFFEEERETEEEEDCTDEDTD